MSRPVPLFWLMVPITVSAFAVVGDMTKVDPAQLEKDYEKEQASIDLVISQFQLDAARGKLTDEQAQDQIDNWTRTNRGRLLEQMERAAELDKVMPLSESREDPSVNTDPVIAGTPQEARINALQTIENQKMDELRSKATTPEQLQDLVDLWARSPAGTALQTEKQRLWEAAVPQKALGTEPIVVEVSEDAGPAEVAILDVQERAARRLMDIRARHPDAGPQAMQDLLDAEKPAFEKEMAEKEQIMKQAHLEMLEAKVARLRAGTEDLELIK